MSQEVSSEYLIYNGEVYATDNVEVVEKTNQRSIYEVVRLLRGVPLYLEEHLNRMKESARLCGLQVRISDQEITQQIAKLMTVNKTYNKNIKIVFSKDGQSYAMFFVDSFYPTPKMRSEGVHTVLYCEERPNPNAKVNDLELRAKITAYRQSKRAYEALLVDKDGMIREGSRSNIFFVNDEGVYTSPKQDVLIGITRTKAIDLCRKLNIPVKEMPIHREQLAKFTGVFMTSTSNNILPISSIEDRSYASAQNSIIKRLAAAFEQDIAAYVQRKQKLSC